MKKWLIRIAVMLVVVIGAGAILFKVKNPPPQLKKPDWFAYYQTQDMKPEGQVGIFISRLIIPETMDQEVYYNVAQKPLQYIPWPIRDLVNTDRGVVLLDPVRTYEFEEFKPTRLADHTGSEKDVDGIAWIEKYRNGEIEWVPPGQTHLSHGNFIYKGRTGGMSNTSQKLMAKARLMYHGWGTVQGKIPHEAGERALATRGMALVETKYGKIPWRFVNAEKFSTAKSEMYSLLDEGIDTLIISAPAAIYSHHEEFNGSFRHAVHYAEDWAKERGKKMPKVIFTRQLGDYAPLRTAFVNRLKERLDTIPKDKKVKLIISYHGMPWDDVPLEAWLKLADNYRKPLAAEMTALIKSYGFPKTEVVISQDHFADPVNNPDGKYLSTNKGFWDGVNNGYDIVVNQPVEFFSENSDTMFAHAMWNFEGFKGWSRYKPIDYPDWNQPLVMTVQEGKTTLIYNGLPAGERNAPIAEALAQSFFTILDQAK